MVSDRIGAPSLRVLCVAALSLGGFVLCSATLSAQPTTPSPWDDQLSRPPLPEAGADTNEARNYYVLARKARRLDPELAARALYWAARLAPSEPAPLALRAQLFWERHRDLERKRRRGRAKPDEVARAERYDSLFAMALMLDPFIPFSADIFPGLLPTLESTNRALRRDPDDAGLRILRAGILRRRGSLDSAVVELRAGRTALQWMNDSLSSPLYESTATFDYAIGRALWALGRVDSARSAYESALTDDLSFYMAHVHLGALAIATDDTTRALDEYARAAEIADGVGMVHFDYGTALLRAQRIEPAIEQLRRAIELEPYFATAYFNLAISLELAGRHADARRTYTLFLERAPRRMHAEIGLARARLAALPPLETPARP